MRVAQGLVSGEADRIFQILELIVNPDYAERLAELRAATDAYIVARNEVTVAKDIEKARSDAASSRATAKEVERGLLDKYAHIENERQAIIAAATVEAEGIIQDAFRVHETKSKSLEADIAAAKAELLAAQNARADAEKIRELAATALASVEALKTKYAAWEARVNAAEGMKL